MLRVQQLLLRPAPDLAAAAAAAVVAAAVAAASPLSPTQIHSVAQHPQRILTTP